MVVPASETQQRKWSLKVAALLGLLLPALSVAANWNTEHGLPIDPARAGQIIGQFIGGALLFVAIAAARNWLRFAPTRRDLVRRRWIVWGSVLLIVVGYAALVVSIRSRPSGLAALEAAENAKLPAKVDDYTTLVNVQYLPTKSVYSYVIDTDLAQLDITVAKTAIQNQLCAQAERMNITTLTSRVLPLGHFRSPPAQNDVAALQHP